MPDEFQGLLLNSGNSVDDPRLPTLSSPSSDSERLCKTCKVERFYSLSFVNCHRCREKNRAKDDLKRARKLAKESHSENAPTAAVSTSASKKAKVEVNVKFRESKNLAELEGEDLEVAMRLMKIHVQRLVKRKGADPYERPPLDPSAGTEYLNATTLYDGLKACLTETPKKLAFKGFHIMVASDDDDPKQRLDLVTRDLRNIVKLRFNHSEAIQKNRNKARTMRYEVFECNCKGFVTIPPPTPVSSKPLPKKPTLSSSGHNMVEYMRLLEKAKAEEAEAKALAAAAAPERRRVECGGTVSIRVEEDRKSHPCGIVGQKVSVVVQHT